MTEFEDDLAANSSSMRRLMRWFVLSSFIVFFGIGGWSVAAKVDSAVVTAGTFAVQSSAQAVQHLEGGVIGAILVKDGDLVQEGQVLVRLDAAKVTADASILERKLIDLTAQKARLEAENQDRTTIARTESPFSSRQMESALRAAFASEESLMNERRFTRLNQLSQQQERKVQVERQIDGFNERYKALKEELAQVTAELADQRMLDSKGLIRRPVLRQTEREVSRLKGEMGDMEAKVAGAHSQLTEIEFKIAELTRNARSEVLKQLQAVTAGLAETEEQLSAAQDRLQRLDIRAPRKGLVHELAVHTIGGIVSPGQKLMSIIPNDEPLIVNAKIRPDEVEQVHVDQRASIRISAFKLPTPLELEGWVTNVSPDQVVSSQSGQAYFTVRIAIAPGERSKLEGKELTPGLPAEVLILGDARRIITYLTQPLTDRLAVTFRE
ncbi:HlyD family type I secretion periplasmic adaptor subunit [Microvirga lotononidis]|uniref:Membrane fusion protein (MFP) family protein n=1 Tax=Microvirga lotononidis TaxID=864069 RepID=I4YKW7_9HYPH|nr:HlyD family type I secretion periplasmic adaptor subunit [Microvirga lotononidis]EIM24609.1 type I secretion membrane fusion protein, HlyD family [Microvirga lotononidis]WQO26624.1 HlyD family type I secretion periplasmic adaptor subunit [Microvirga lotononidis]